MLVNAARPTLVIIICKAAAGCQKEAMQRLVAEVFCKANCREALDLHLES